MAYRNIHPSNNSDRKIVQWEGVAFTSKKSMQLAGYSLIIFSHFVVFNSQDLLSNLALSVTT